MKIKRLLSAVLTVVLIVQLCVFSVQASTSFEGIEGARFDSLLEAAEAYGLSASQTALETEDGNFPISELLAEETPFERKPLTEDIMRESYPTSIVGPYLPEEAYVVEVTVIVDHAFRVTYKLPELKTVVYLTYSLETGAIAQIIVRCAERDSLVTFTEEGRTVKENVLSDGTFDHQDQWSEESLILLIVVILISWIVWQRFRGVKKTG